MKKSLLTFGAALMITGVAQAQLALENFDHAGAKPAGWTMINDGHIVSSSFTGLPWLQDSLDNNAWFPVHAYGATSDYQMISTSYFTPAATSDRWLISPAFTVTSPNMVLQWEDYDLSSGENLEVWVSPTAGTTAADFTTMLYNGPAASGALTIRQAALTAYNGTTITIAFREHVNDGWGLLVDDVQTVILPSTDMGVTALNLPPFAQTGSSLPITGTVHNYGVATTTSMDLNYSVNGGAPVVTSLSSLSIPLGGNYNFTSGTPWVPSASGTYNIKAWAENINSGVDADNTNDTFYASVLVIDTLQPKRVMIEEFTQASCDPCANAHVNVDTVYENNMSRASMLRYHVNFPGRDCMDSVTLAPFVSARLSYYGVNGVPDAQVDGYYVYPGAAGPGTFSSTVIGQAAAAKSPLSMNVTASYASATGTYSFTANITGHGNIPAGLKVYACLVVDTLTYHANQSTESIPQTIFPQVAEAMIPNASGTALAAFTGYGTQTITKSWVKNHPWGSNFSVWSYDSTKTGKIIVWVEDDANQYVYQCAEAAVPTVPTSANIVTASFGSLDVYPNPAATVANVSLHLNEAANVKMEIFNVAGRLVHSMNTENRRAGTSTSAIDLSGFAAGEYFVKVTVGTEVVTRKLVVIK